MIILRLQKIGKGKAGREYETDENNETNEKPDESLASIAFKKMFVRFQPAEQASEFSLGCSVAQRSETPG